MEASLIARLEKAVTRLEALGVGLSSAPAGVGISNVAGSTASTAPSALSTLADWDKLLAEHLAPVKALSQYVPPEAQQSMQNFDTAFQRTRRVFEVAAAAKKPDDPAGLQSLLAPVGEAMGAVAAAAAIRSSCPNHLKVLSEAVSALGFMAYTGPGSGMSAPRQHVADCWQSAEFFANKLLMEFRGKDDNQVAWVQGLKALVQQQLQQFVVRNCVTGVRFNADGVPLAAAMNSTAAGNNNNNAPAPAASVPAPGSKPAAGRPAAPPPPPPGPPPKPPSVEELAAADGGEGSAGGGMASIFKELSKGEGITRSLRHVTSEMKTKNNPDRRSVVPAVAAAAAATPSPASLSSGGAMAATSKKAQSAGPSRLELNGTKWIVENFTGRQDLVVDNPAPKNSVYVYGCTDCVVQVQGKVNAITLDNCSRVGVVFCNVISSVEAVNCRSVQLQATGTVPTIAVDKTDGAQLYLSQACAADPNFQIVSAKSSSTNVVVVPAEDDTRDPLEQPIPEQYISTFREGRLVTVAAEHSGA